MNIFIADDSLAIRTMLRDIISSENLGKVVGEADDGIYVNNDVLAANSVDILLIDLLMKKRDGLETIRNINPNFKGKIVMVSQVDNKESVAEAYLLGVEHYITKPINKYEVISVIQKVTKYYLQEISLANIQQSLLGLNGTQQQEKMATPSYSAAVLEKENELSQLITKGNNILMDLGIVGESGHHDLLNIIEHLYELEEENKGYFQFPPLKDLFEEVAKRQNDPSVSDTNDLTFLKKEAKATEQRVRRTIHQALYNLASIGTADFGSPIFENYASRFFDFSQVRVKMLEIEENKTEASACRLNIKKFIEVLYMEVKRTDT